MYEKIRVGNYLIIGEQGDWSVMEQFGGYRMLKKKFKTVEKATECINGMMEVKKNYTS